MKGPTPKTLPKLVRTKRLRALLDLAPELAGWPAAGKMCAEAHSLVASYGEDEDGGAGGTEKD